MITPLKQIIESTAPMVDLGMYDFKDFNTDKTTSEESFMNVYA